MPYPKPKNEKKRLLALYEYNILDTLPEDEYDSITLIAAQICNVPASLITMLDKDRQWFKSNRGVGINETPREFSFCNHTILNPKEVLVVPDMRKDIRFANNPLVAGEPHAVFYAGAPLVTPEGFVLGSICVLDAKANNLSDEQKQALKGLADQVITRLELRRKIQQLKSTQKDLKLVNKKLEEFAKIASHDLKTPVANIAMLSKSFQSSFADKMDENSNEYMQLINSSAKELLQFIDNVLVQSLASDKKKGKRKLADSMRVIQKVINFIAPPEDIEIELKGEFPKVNMDATALQQVFQNLLTNAIKYNDKQKGIIHIESINDKSFHTFNICDNGAGIEKENIKKIFQRNKTLGKTDRFGNKGTGIGLAKVKNIIENTGGSIAVESKKSIGSVFKIRIPHFA